MVMVCSVPLLLKYMLLSGSSSIVSRYQDTLASVHSTIRTHSHLHTVHGTVRAHSHLCSAVQLVHGRICTVQYSWYTVANAYCILL